MAVRSLSAQAGSRKCWASLWKPEDAPKLVPAQVASQILHRLAAPVLFLDRFDLLLASSRNSARTHGSPSPPRSLESPHRPRTNPRSGTDRSRCDPGRGVAIAPAPLRQGSALIEAEERVLGTDLHLLQDVRRRLVLDDDGNVLHRVAKPLGISRTASSTRRVKRSRVIYQFVAGPAAHDVCLGPLALGA